MGCSTAVVKYLVFFFNLIFAVAGATLIGVGVLLKLKNNDIENFIPDKYHLGLPPILMIAIGSVVFLTAFFGCCGAIKESTCMLTTFAIILLTLLIIQVAIGAYAFLIIGDTQDLRQSVRQVVEKSYNQYNETRAIKEEFDFLQTFIAGIGLIIYGSCSTYLILISNSEMIIRDYGTIVPSAMTVIFGLALVIFVFLGCCGVCRESTCCMETYSSFLILLALSHFALGAYCTVVYYYGENDNLGRQIKNDLTYRVVNYRDRATPMDDIQKWLKCCGVIMPEQEYKNFDGFLPNGSELPATCCDNMQICNIDSIDRYHKDCLSSVYEFTIYTNIIIGFISLGTAAVELVAALLGICLSCCIWRNQSVAVWR